MNLRRFFHLGAVTWLTWLLTFSEVSAQKAWFADGFHGGVYGHYPFWVTQFMVDQLQQHPDWRLNLEIEPETWDVVRTNTPEAYEKFKAIAVDQSSGGRIEFVNPAYGQSYLWNISGESVIQQFARGMEKLREHFPDAKFTTYSSEEPCFTSALPEILNSFGFKNAVLKNPNTCWGGYTRAFGGELVNWIGPDGSAIRTVPRYGIESLQPGSTWQTIAAANSPEYVNAALRDDIRHPIGMCLQDAGWRNGPWLRDGRHTFQPTEYTTWRNYFENVAGEMPEQDWHFSQEDVQVSLVWGAQVLQRIAQEVRAAENQIVTAEKMAALASCFGKASWPKADFDEAWRTLLLSQHHDCWIVPYNGRQNDTWADKVARWTGETRKTADEVIERSISALTPNQSPNGSEMIRVFNTVAANRSDLVCLPLPIGWTNSQIAIRDSNGKSVPAQIVIEKGLRKILFRAAVPSLGFNTFAVENRAETETEGAMAIRQSNGIVRLESDFYRVEFDPKKGGAIRSLIAKTLNNRELVDAKSKRSFNEMRGYFFDRKEFLSNAETPAEIEILEKGPVRVRLKITGQIASNAVTQWIRVTQSEPRIDFRVKIDWQGNPRIGSDFEQAGGFRGEHDRKAFYDDRFKLLALFPVDFEQQQIFKDAPFDLTESHLTNTFFNSWSDIKNNVILNWVDLYDAKNDIGLALFTDHTTGYAHGVNHPLGLTLQYAGVGLWGRDYSVRGPTEINYALMPHSGNTCQANVWTAGNRWNEPLIGKWLEIDSKNAALKKSLLAIDDSGWEVPTMRQDAGKILIRLFNASTDRRPTTFRYSAAVSRIELVKLNGELISEIPFHRDSAGHVNFEIALPRLGMGTLRITP